VVVLAGAAALALVGCSGALISNLTEESQSNISVLLINNTDFRASFTIGAFDDFDRNPPGQVSFQQPRVEAHTSAAPINFGCFRDVAIGSDKLLTRILATDGDDMANFDPDTFVTGVNFSTAPLGSDGAALPDAGKGGARTVRLGVDYGCDDQLIFTFEQNDDGTFRIDYSVVVNARGDE
jgi:hypothetical protein